MAEDSRKITIEIVGGEGDDNEENVVSTKSSDSILKKYKKDKQERLARKMAIISLAKRAASQSIQIADSLINTYFSLTEDYKGQTTYQNIKSVLSQMNSVSTNIASGAITGATVGGPVGAIIGAGVGVIKSGVDMATHAHNVHLQQNLDIATKGYSAEYNRNLAGLIVGDGRNTEN